MFGVLWVIAKWLLIVSSVLAYVDVGPGGEYVGSVVNGLKAWLITIDWASVWVTIKTGIAEAALWLSEQLKNIAEIKEND